MLSCTRFYLYPIAAITPRKRDRKERERVSERQRHGQGHEESYDAPLIPGIVTDRVLTLSHPD